MIKYQCSILTCTGLANRQGMTSQSDVELSVISKNFFFTFFNFFVVFTILGTASNFLSLLKDLNDSLRDTTRIAWTLAESLLKLQGLYVNFLILQALGLLPLRLLEIGAVVLYPIYRMGAKTPRDFAELTKPPVFSYGMYAPQVLLIFIICITYSVLEESWKILLAGCAYFVIGSFVYKYQLLYAMDHRQHSTGRSWIMMCNRFLVGLVFFQLTVGGQLAAKHAPIRGAMIVPLLFATVWFTYSYNRTYDPLMRYIALKSVRGAENAGANAYRDDNDIPEDLARWRTDSGRQSIADSSDEPAETSEPAFVNPNLVSKWVQLFLSYGTMLTIIGSNLFGLLLTTQRSMPSQTMRTMRTTKRMSWCDVFHDPTAHAVLILYPRVAPSKRETTTRCAVLDIVHDAEEATTTTEVDQRVLHST